MTYPFGDAEQFFSFEKIEDSMLRAYLYDETGVPRARVMEKRSHSKHDGIVVDEFLRKLLLNEAIRRAGDPLRRATYPIGIFISYKWAGEQRRAKVAFIADTLKELGWKVHFDEGQPRTVAEVATYVARLAASRYVLSIWTDDYATETVGAHPSKAEWLFDEINYAMASYNHRGEPQIIALWLEGDTPPHGHEGLDARSFNQEQLTAALTRRFSYDGPHLDDAETVALHASLAECVTHLRSGERNRLLSEIDRILDAYPFVHAANRLKIIALYESGRLEEAIAAARTAQRAVHSLDGRTSFTGLLASMLGEAGQRQEALALQCELLETEERPLWMQHFGAAVNLVALKEHWAARAHFLRAADLPRDHDRPAWAVLANLPQIYRGLGRDDTAMVLGLALRKHMGDRQLEEDVPRAAAADILSSLDAMDAADEELPPIRCSSCRAALPSMPAAACGRCGASRPPVKGQPCRCCGHRGFVPFGIIEGDTSVRCPICRHGWLRRAATSADQVRVNAAGSRKRPWWRRLF
jgi:tetratricopeptide (TPR) repeat protein